MSNHSGISNLFSLLIILSIPFGLTSCKSSSKVSKTANKEIILKRDSLKSQELLELISENYAHPSWVSAKSNIKTESPSKSHSFNLNLRYQKDSAIWLSFSPLLGIEVARVLITPDSIKVMDRHNKKYLREEFSYLSEMFQFDLTFKQLEALLLGNLFDYVREGRYKSIYMDKEIYVLSTLSKRKIIKTLKEKEPHKNIIQDVYIDPETNRILATNVTDEKHGRVLKLKYSELKETISGVIPQKAIYELIISEGDRLKLSVSHAKFVVDEKKSLPFKIPTSYEAMR